jgi:hypothetical protein
MSTNVEGQSVSPNDAKPNVIHRLRWMVRDFFENITDEELDYLETKLPIGQYLNYEYSGNFIITKDVIKRDAAVENMCCGIVTKDVEMPINKWLYFAFDYGH